MDFKQRCNHDWEVINTKLVCKNCGASKLMLKKINDDLYEGTRANGKRYLIRIDKNKYLYPHEWNKFMSYLREDNKLIFDFLICTGARIEEALFVKKANLVDDRRKLLRLTLTKRKAKKFGEQEDGKIRTLEIKSSLYNELSKSNHDYIFLKIDGEYSREELKKLTKSKSQAVRGLFKRGLKYIGLNPKLYNLHNIRKTHGMWLKALGVSSQEMNLRLGHDESTYLKHYGSPTAFDGKDKELMIKIIGRIYGL